MSPTSARREHRSALRSTNLRSMSEPGKVVLRRSWPQRLVILCTLAVMGGAIASAWFLDDVYGSVTGFGRVEIPGSVLLTDTEPGSPVNFLLIGQDSATGLDADDPAALFREVDPRGTFNADSITILRVNPTSGQAWVLSVPRDLIIEDRGIKRRINQVLLVEGPERLVEVVTANFGIPINHYVSLDFFGFRQVVDELDGVPIWFDHPARDFGSGLDIATSGCYLLDGVEALQYVRARKYQELRDGEWEFIGNSDFGRVERQQDFLVLALDRAISRGAREPTTLAALIGAGADSMVLDGKLTVAELVDVGEAFADFNSENLERYSLQVRTDIQNGMYIGERLIDEVNEPTFAVFKGETDLPTPTQVTFDLYSAAAESLAVSVEQFETLGFTVDRRYTLDTADDGNTIVYGPSSFRAAETLARWLLPIPRLVEDVNAEGLSLVLGEKHEQILFIVAHSAADMRSEVEARGDGPIPDLSGGASVTSTTRAPSTTSAGPSDETLAPTTTTGDGGGVIGRAPEGQSCG